MKLADNRMVVTAGGVFLLTTVLIRERLTAGILSLSGAAVRLATGHLNVEQLMHHRLLDVWIGSAFWCVCGVFLLAMVAGRFAAVRIWINGERTIVRRAAGGLILVTFFIATAAPLLSPLNPSAQGDLLTARLLPPFSRGSVALPPPDTARAAASWESLVGSANDLFLRQGKFSGEEAATGRPSIVFVLGTDDLGRDVLSRVMYGARVSCAIGVLSALGALLIGAGVGIAAGWTGGWTDALLMRSTDVILAVPSVLLAIGCIAALGSSWPVVVLVLVATGWMGVARIVRAEVTSVREKEFILAARMLSVPSLRIIRRHVLPNIMPVLTTAGVLQFAGAVLAEAALGFLGLGIGPPTASWGNMMGEATGYLSSGWWVGAFPGALLSAVVIAAHVLVESPRDHGAQRAP